MPGSSKTSVLYAIAASMMLAALAVPAAASPKASANWDKVCDRIASPASASESRPPLVLANDAWLTRLPDPPSARTSIDRVVESDFHAFAASEQTLIPLPSAEWSGLVGLAALAVVRARKALRRILS